MAQQNKRNQSQRGEGNRAQRTQRDQPQSATASTGSTWQRAQGADYARSGARRGLLLSSTSLLGGLSIGAALMYLFDPESGRTRRGYLGEATSDVLGRAGDAVGSAWEHLSDTAGNMKDAALARGSALGRDVSSSVGSGLGDAGDAAGSFLHRARKTLSRSASHIADHGSQLVPNRSWLPHVHYHDEPSSTATILVTAFSFCALGALMMYGFDPSQGRRRRALARDKISSTARRTGQALEKKARHVGNVARGLYHESATAVSGAVGGASGTASSASASGGSTSSLGTGSQSAGSQFPGSASAGSQSSGSQSIGSQFGASQSTQPAASDLNLNL
jgi:hypothetical protein